jgi:hypothetical protein
LFVVWGFSIFELLIFCALSSFVNVKLVSNFHYSHLNFKVNIFNEFNDYWHYIIDIFFFLIMLKFLKPNCHKKKKKRIVQEENLFLQLFEVALSSSMQCQFICIFLLIKRLGHIRRLGGKSLNNLHYTLGFDKKELF